MSSLARAAGKYGILSQTEIYRLELLGDEIFLESLMP
jgi:hypothetical protein